MRTYWHTWRLDNPPPVPNLPLVLFVAASGIATAGAAPSQGACKGRTGGWMSHRGVLNACGRLTDVAVALALVAVGLCILVPSATAAIGGELTRFGSAGSGPGDFGAGAQGAGMAADPTTGHLFVADQGNNRIDEFTAWGEFVKAWGWDVADGSSSELQACSTACLAGTPGPEAGQLDQPNGIALSSSGDVYVFERVNRRVQVFSLSGDFLFMFGGSVNHTTGADTCTKADVEGGDVCGAGAEGTGSGEFSISPNGFSTSGDYIDIGPTGIVYVADRGRIEEFELDGTFKGEVSFSDLEADDSAFPSAREPGGLEVDPQTGDIYIAFRSAFAESPAQGSLWRLSSAGHVLFPAPLMSTSAAPSERFLPEAVAVDDKGTVYAAVEQFSKENETNLADEPMVVQMDNAGHLLDSCCSATAGRGIYAITTNTVTASGGVDLYVFHYDPFQVENGRVFVEVRGPAPDKWPPPSVAPDITGQFAAGVSDHSATLRAEVNPNFWADTSYFLEYGTSPCSDGGCLKTPIPPGELLGAGAVKTTVTTSGIELTDLSPGTTYHYRFVAQSGGGGPVYGEDPDGSGPEEETFAGGLDRTFTTFAPSPSTSTTTCPNDAFRTGTAAHLQDCRAYEMVSPVDKLGGDIIVQMSALGFPAGLNQAAEDGERITYSSYRALADSASAGYSSQFLASRTASGWSTEAISPPREGPPVYGGLSLDAPYKAFLDDLSVGWLRQETDPLLAPNAVPDFANLYERTLPGGGYSAITTTAPTNQQASGYVPDIQGFSADGSRTVFGANGKLTSNASANNIWQVYESFEGTVRLVSIRPNGSASSVDAFVGSSTREQGAQGEGRGANVSTAVSDDGSKIYWSEEADGKGKIYVRVNRTKTVQVSAGPATFWAASPSGTEAVYTEAGELKLFNLEAGQSTVLASTVHGVLGASSDLRRVYFVATGVLANGAEAGNPNLYLYEAGQPLHYIATLSSADLGEAPGSIGVDLLAPWRRVARVSPDGRSVVFMSRASLTGRDTKDTANGQADAEIYRYTTTSPALACISCSPAGARPTGREFALSNHGSGYWYASSLTGLGFQLHFPRVIASDGNRVFFNSFNRLVLADTNGAQDVYEWEAPGTGTCAEGSSAYSAQAVGCVSLISDGHNPGDSEFVDADIDGRDAFFTTASSLVAADPGQVDVYDARVDGGFAAPVSPKECTGEDCQQSPLPPPVPPSASEGSNAGNPRFRPHCKKGFVHKHRRCIRNHKHDRNKHHKRRTHKKQGGQK
jgi:hypothetical protein